MYVDNVKNSVMRLSHIVALHDCIILSLKYEKIKNHKMGKIMLS